MPPIAKADPAGDGAGENVFAILTRGSRGRGDQPFLLPDAGPAVTYAGLFEETLRVAAWLRDNGVGTGDRVVVQADKSVAAVLLYLGCLRAGAVFVPLNVAYTEPEVAYFLDDAAPALVVAGPGTAAARIAFAGRRAILGPSDLDADLDAGRAPWARTPPAGDTVAVAADDPAAILYTSGTTGRSKGAVLTHRNLASNALVLHDVWAWQDGDVLLHALPINHAHGLFVALHGALLNGSSVIFHQKFDAAAVVRDLPRASVFMGVPTFYTRLLDTPAFDAAACRTMRLFVSGSAPLLPATFEAFGRRTGHAILERYGMTEALMVTSNPYGGPRRAGTVGHPLPGIDVRIATEDGTEAPAGQAGILQLRGPNLFAGYWRNPAKTAAEHTADGYFVSGDIAVRDAAGVIQIVGRAKDLIISGGFNVYPREVELALDAQPGVAESAVIGVPHPDFGEGVLAVVVGERGASLDADVLAAAIGPGLARFKRPKRIVLADDLPRNAMGKVQKAVLRERHAAAFATE